VVEKPERVGRTTELDLEFNVQCDVDAEAAQSSADKPPKVAGELEVYVIERTIFTGRFPAAASIS
jgi:hypothetical protein